MRTELESIFRNLTNTTWRIKSPWDDTYQCIAWAACRTDSIWWPVDIPPPPGSYWPSTLPIDDKVEYFVQAFAALGYGPCGNCDFEFGYQKIAIYAGDDGHVRHMARQHFFGKGWLSKLGKLEDIFHADLRSIEGDPSPNSYEYGRVAQVLKRSWWVSLRNLCLLRCVYHALKFCFYRTVYRWG